MKIYETKPPHKFTPKERKESRMALKKAFDKEFGRGSFKKLMKLGKIQWMKTK